MFESLLINSDNSDLISFPDDPDCIFWLNPTGGISDRSQRKIPITNSGVTVSTDSPYPGIRSLLFKESQFNRLVMPYAQMGSLLRGDFTIEYWFKRESNKSGSQAIFSQWYQVVGQGGFVITAGLNGASDFHFGPYSENGVLQSNTAYSLNEWEHRAYTRSGNLLMSFRNGILDKTTSVTATRDPISVNYVVGSYYSPSATIPANGSTSLVGKIANLRVYNVAKRTTNFTPV